MKKDTILQGFEWYLPADAKHWRRLEEVAAGLHQLGITGIWLPPASKAASGIKDVGYGTYDLYDLGEFDQKGTVPTKYGTKEEYLQAIRQLQKNEIAVYADIVLDHFMGADETERVSATAYSFDDRTQPISGEQEIEAWTRFTFPGRKGRYNEYVWHAENFSGVDYDAHAKEHAVFNFNEKGWAPEVDSENGNYDYLMGCNLDMENPETIQQLQKWGQWFLEQTDLDGFRLDAVKHIQFDFFTQWLLARREEAGKELFVVGEYWSDDAAKLEEYLDSSGNIVPLFDVPLHFNLYEASNSMGNYDMSRLFAGTLTESRPDWAVTFVDNHDTQAGQSLQSWVQGWFRQHAYALILLRYPSVPVVFWGDLFGIPSQEIDSVGDGLLYLLRLRKELTIGSQADYFDDQSIVGWIDTGSFADKRSGLAVIMTDSVGGEKEMTVSAVHNGRTFVDLLQNNAAEIVIDEDGKARFPVNDGQVSVYVNKELAAKIWQDVEELKDQLRLPF